LLFQWTFSVEPGLSKYNKQDLQACRLHES